MTEDQQILLEDIAIRTERISKLLGNNLQDNRAYWLRCFTAAVASNLPLRVRKETAPGSDQFITVVYDEGISNAVDCSEALLAEIERREGEKK